MQPMRGLLNGLLAFPRVEAHRFLLPSNGLGMPSVLRLMVTDM